MPEKAAILTALILERPLCAECIREKSGLTVPEIDETFTLIRRVLVFRHYDRDRCRACGEIRTVFALERRAT